MSAQDNGGSAFPEAGLSNLPNGDFIQPNPGMTLRDYFAAKALAANVLALSTTPAFTKSCLQEATDCDLPLEEYVALRCLDWADAMLRARSQ